MTYSEKYQQLTAQRAYSRAVATCGLSALVAPYTARPVIPAQRRRFVNGERISA